MRIHNWHLPFLLLVSALLLTAFLIGHDDDPAAPSFNPALPVRPSTSPVVVPEKHQVALVTNSTQGTRSQENEMQALDKRIALRRKKMAGSHYATPHEYDSMSLKTLKELAKKGDVFAMLQLGEQFYSEGAELRSNPEYETVDNKLVAKQYFADAVAAGHIHIADILVAKYVEENNLVDAYAWHLLSKRFKDVGIDELYRRDSIYAGLSNEQINEANIKFAALWQQATRRFQAK